MYGKPGMEVISTAAQDMERKVRDILTYIGEDPDREGLIDTPKRMVKWFDELFKPEEPRIAVFESDGYTEMIIEKDIPFYTFCEHHFLPFFGTVKIGYIPDGKIIGLSKLSRIAEYFSKRLNTQEYFTMNIANYLQEKLQPKGVGVIVTGRHLCKEMRGVKKNGQMITTSFKGIMETDRSLKEDFIYEAHRS
jgi:GTP cyclohydrolase I